MQEILFSEKCIRCGEIIPDGKRVCPNCFDLKPIKPYFKPINHISIPSNTLRYTDELDATCYVSKIIAKVVDMQEKMVYESIIEWARENGYTDVFLIDEEFIKRALNNEIERMR